MDPPEVPLQRTKPERKLAVLVAGFFGLGLGMFLAFFREYVTNSNKEEKDKLSEAKSLVLKNISDFIPKRLK